MPLDKIFDYALTEAREMRRAPVAASLLVVVGVIVGWLIAGVFYGGRIDTIKEQVALLEMRVQNPPPLPTPDPLRETEVVKSWGFVDDYGCSVTVDGRKLKEFIDKYQLVMICGIQRNDIDHANDPVVTVSRPFRIVLDDVRIVAPLSSVMQKEGEEIIKAKVNGHVSVWFELGVVPKDVRMEAIKTVADVEKIGGKLASRMYAQQGVTLPDKKR